MGYQIVSLPDLSLSLSLLRAEDLRKTQISLLKGKRSGSLPNALLVLIHVPPDVILVMEPGGLD
jgi:hypothetical protein